MKISIIGAGNIGGALARGWSRKGQEVTVTARTQRTLEKFKGEENIHPMLDNVTAVQGADVIVLAVEPEIVVTVLSEIMSHVDTSRQIICSVAAGGTDRKNVIYCMPNIAAEFGESMTFIARTEHTPEQHVEVLRDLFKLLGDVLVCAEHLMPAGLVMAGCGIAYVMRYLRAQTAAGVEMGFKPKEALRIALQTTQGAVSLLHATGEHPEEAIDRVTTAGGRTIKGLNELDHTGFNSSIIRCLKAGLK